MHGALGSLDSLAGVPLHSALELTGVGLTACDAAGRVTLISPMLQELFGIEYEPVAEPYVERFQLLCSDGVTVLPDDEVPLTRARRGEFVKDAMVAARRGDGSLMYLCINATPLRDEAGRDNGAIALVQDVTVEREAALRTEALRKRLVETINHEFRTPLAALLAHVELVNEHSDGLDPELVGWLQAIERSGWRLRDLVQEVAEMVSCEAGDCPVDRRPRSV